MKVLDLDTWPEGHGESRDSRDVSFDFISKIEIISSQSVVFFTGNLFASIAGYTFTLFVARALGSRNLGLFALGMSVVSIGVIISTLGLNSAAPRFVALYSGRGETLKLLAFIRFGLIVITLSSTILGGAIVLGRSWIGNSLFHEDSLIPYLPLFSLMVPISAIGLFLLGVLTGYQKVASRTIIDSYLRISLKIFSSLALILLGWGLAGWLIGEISGGLIAIILTTWLIIKLRPASELGWSSTFSKLDGEVVPFAVTLLGIGITIFTWNHVSRIILGIYLDAEQVGIFTAALTIGAFIPTIQSSINSIFAPVIAELHGTGEYAEIAFLFKTLTKWAIGLTWPITAVVIIFAPLIMRFYGAEFEKGWMVLVIISFGQLVNVGVGSVGVILIMTGHQRLEFLAAICAALVSLILSVILIPLWGILGAGIASSAGFAIANLLRLLIVYKAIGLIPYSHSTIKLFPSIGASGIVVFIVRQWSSAVSGPGWQIIFISLILSFTAFFVVAAVQGLESSDRIILKALILRLFGGLQKGSGKKL